MAAGVRIPHWLAQARQILDQDFRERLTTTQIARVVGVHPVYLAQVFRQYFGVGVIEYLVQQRVAFASRELRETTDSIAEIASSAGFYDQGHFARTFKRLTGSTPSEYRRRHGG